MFARFAAALLVFCLCRISVADQDDLQVDISRIRSTVSATRQRGEFSLRLNLLLKVTNSSNTAIPMTAPSVSLEMNDVSQRILLPEGGQLPVGQLAPNQTIPIQLSVEIESFPAELPKLVIQLHFSGEADATFSTSLTDRLAESHRYKVEYLGPKKCLAVISLDDSPDPLSVWFLGPQLRSIHDSGVRRVILSPSEPSAAGRVPLLVRQWLQNALGTPNPRAAVLTPFTPLPADFFSLNVVGSNGGMSSPFDRGASLFSEELQQAIFDSLSAVYRVIPKDEAFADLGNENSGVRRAALLGIIDSLTFTEAAPVLNRISGESTEFQRDLVSCLRLIPGKEAILALKDLALGDNAELALTALLAIAIRADDHAVDALSDIWEEGLHRPELRHHAAEAMLGASNISWHPFLEDYIDDYLEAATQGNSGGYNTALIGSILETLEVNGLSSVGQKVTETASKLGNSPARDALLKYLLQKTERSPAQDQLLLETLGQQVQEGRVSTNIQLAALRLRPAEWTESLFADFLSGPKGPTPSIPFDAILACATPEQLRTIAESRDQLDPETTGLLLTAMAVDQVPEWKPFAAEVLSREPDRHTLGVVQLLAQDASEQSIAILINAARKRISSLEGTRDASSTGQQFLQQTLSQLAMMTHPECRRFINQLCRDPNQWVAELAETERQNARSRSPAIRALIEEYQQRKAGDTKAALSALQLAVELDPFLPDCWVRSSSVKMHAGEFESSMRDLQRADALSPDNSEVLSMKALVNVRLGNVQQGLDTADALIAEMPKDDFALYNGACTYARAAERNDSSENDRTTWTDRAIALLDQTNATGFTDFEHLQQDPDLSSLHQHPRWQSIVETARRNAEQDPPAAE